MAKVTQITETTFIDLSTVYKIVRKWYVVGSVYDVTLYTAHSGFGSVTQERMTVDEWDRLVGQSCRKSLDKPQTTRV